MKKLETVLPKLMTPKRIAISLTILYLLSLIPLLLIGRYSVPTSDDLSIGLTCRDAWLSTGSVWAVIGQAFAKAWNSFFEWMGCYTSMCLMALHPGVWGEQYYLFTPWIMLGMLSTGTMYFLHAVFVKCFKMNKYISHSITMLVLFITVQCMAGRREAFFWYNGATHYILLHSLSLFFFGTMLSMFVDQKSGKRFLNMIMACILAFLVGGGNYMTGLNVCIVMATAFVVLLMRKQLKIYAKVWIPFGIFLVGFILNCVAPGNQVRAAGTAGMNPIKAVFVSFYYCLDYCLSEWTNWAVIILMLMCIPLFWKGCKNIDFKFSYPVIFIGYSFCVLSAMVTPPLYALGNISADRLQALFFAMYILILTMDVGYVVGWLQKKMWNAQSNELHADSGFSVNSCIAILVLGSFFVFGSVLCIVPSPHYYTFSSALTDLRNGNAKAYSQAMQERLTILHDSQVTDVVFEALPAEPELLCDYDLSDDPVNWVNQAMAQGYHKNSVVVKRTK